MRLYALLIQVIVFILVGTVPSLKLFGQCPQWQLSIPDTVCQNTPTFLSASSAQSGFTTIWDFNAGDSKNQPLRSVEGTYPILSQGSSGFDLEYDNGIMYGFTVRPNSLTRVEFPNDTTLPPIVTDLGNLGLISFGAIGVNIIKDDNFFYGLINLNSGDLIRLEFGSSLTNIPIATPIVMPAGLANSPFYMDLSKMGQDIVAMIPNWSSQSATIVNFGSSMMNTPTAFNITLPGSNPVSVSLANECGNLCAFVAYFSADPITRISFGNAVSQTQYTTSSINFTNSNFYREITVINDGLEWILFATSGGGNVIDAYRFGGNLSNLDPNKSILIIANANDFYFSDFQIYNSRFSGYGLNTATGDLSRVVFPELKTANPEYSTQQFDSVIFQDEGIYYISFLSIDSSGNTQRISDSIVVVKQPVAAFTANSGCLNTPVSFLNNSSQDAISFSWNFGDSNFSTIQSPSHLYQQEGDFPVILTVTNANGCTNSLLDTVSVFQQPIASFTFSNFACSGSPLNLNDNSSTTTGVINDITWIIDGNDTLFGPQPNFSINQDGIFNITLITGASTGCFDTSAALCTILPGPIAGFETSSTCLGDSVKFINNTTIATGLNTDFLWRFSAIDSSTIAEPSFLFPTTNPGNYLVSLAATSSNGCTDTVINIIHVGPPANVDFGIDDDTVCTFSPVQFSDSTLISPTETILERIWDFGDGQLAYSSQSTTHSYTAPGTYMVQLTVQTATNCTAAFSKSIFVIESPKAGFYTQSVCEDVALLFQDTSSSSSTTQLTQWSWTFDSLGSSTAQSPTFIFSDTGTYNILLEVTDNNGCSTEIDVPLSIQPRPLAGFNTSNPCSNSPVIFTDSSQISSGSIAQWSWDFGDGSAGSSIQNPMHVFQNAGAYFVQFIVRSTYGCPDTASLFLPVNPSPEFNMFPSQACYGLENSFGFNFTNTTVQNPTFIWNFGDSTFSLQASPTHLYNTPGSRIVLLTITDLDNGCIQSDSINAIVLENPEADFQSQEICLNDTLYLQDQSSGEINDPVISWQWTSSLFQNIYGQSQSLQPSQTGTFEVQLSISSAFGCKDSVSKDITINELPDVAFTANPYFGAPPLTVAFTNNSNPGQSIWDFNDGSMLNFNRSPTHIFQDTGTFIVSLGLTDSNGCVNYAQDQIFVLQPLLDLAINQVEYNEIDNTYEIKVKLRNNGNNIVTSFRIRIELKAKSPVIEKVENIEIFPGDVYNHTSAVSFISDGEDPEFICAELLEVNDTTDQVPSNDKKCVVLSDETKIFDLYPNPVLDDLIIPVYVKTQSRIEIDVFDSLGRRVREKRTYFIPKGLSNIELDLNNLFAAQYFLEITIGNEKTIRSFIKSDRP